MQRYRGALARLQAVGLQSARGMAAAAQPAPVEDTIEVTVDGQKVSIPKGANVLAACDAAGKDIPRCALARWRRRGRGR